MAVVGVAGVVVTVIVVVEVLVVVVVVVLGEDKVDVGFDVEEIDVDDVVVVLGEDLLDDDVIVVIVIVPVVVVIDIVVVVLGDVLDEADSEVVTVVVEGVDAVVVVLGEVLEVVESVAGVVVVVVLGEVTVDPGNDDVPTGVVVAVVVAVVVDVVDARGDTEADFVYNTGVAGSATVVVEVFIGVLGEVLPVTVVVVVVVVAVVEVLGDDVVDVDVEIVVDVLGDEVVAVVVLIVVDVLGDEVVETAVGVPDIAVVAVGTVNDNEVNDAARLGDKLVGVMDFVGVDAVMDADGFLGDVVAGVAFAAAAAAATAAIVSSQSNGFVLRWFGVEIPLVDTGVTFFGVISGFSGDVCVVVDEVEVDVFKIGSGRDSNDASRGDVAAAGVENGVVGAVNFSEFFFPTGVDMNAGDFEIS